NLADLFLKTHGGDSAWDKNWDYDLWLVDNSTVHARVGSYRPNAFGLHDTIGNVMEWCQDPYQDHDLSARNGAGERAAAGVRLRSMRGSNCLDVSAFARSSRRTGQLPEFHQVLLGVRPARALMP